MRTALGTMLVAGALALAGCDSSDDGAGSMDPTGSPGGGPGGTPSLSGDIFDIVSLTDTDDAAALDRATLQGQLDTLLGDPDTAEPLAVEDDDTAPTVLQRRRDAGR